VNVWTQVTLAPREVSVIINGRCRLSAATAEFPSPGKTCP
jgi:hypothetical protein